MLSLPSLLVRFLQHSSQLKVIEAGFDIDFGKPAYKIEIIKGTQVHKVLVDSMTGKIIRSQVETADNDD